ncbi:hypothetical protein GQ42DRAFT_164152 [Ramicandelaber brevisporus]|nr:hypothetical protein GQ42DRAFT_164152 [Ramicandelaber brevisporus]
MLFDNFEPKHRRSWSSSMNRFRSTEGGLPAADGNSALFVLPYDILEEVATTCFSRREAVELLTVNSHFHDAFSRAVWHTINTIDKSVKSISDAAWQRYGHLVRRASLDINQIGAQWFEKMPSLVELKLYLTSQRFEMAGEVKLVNLRRIKFVSRARGWTNSDVKKCMDLVQQLEQYNKTLLVHWNLIFMRDGQVAAVESVANRIDDPARHSFSIAYQASYPLVFSQFSKLSQMLVKLDIRYSPDHFRDFFKRSIIVPEYTFPRLNTLQLSADYGIGYNRLLETILTPVHFPSLNRMHFKAGESNSLSGFSTGASHIWSTVTELKFLCSSNSDSVNQALKQVPSLERLILEGCTLKLKMASLAKHLPHLKYLEFGKAVHLEGDHQHELQSDGNIYAPMASLKEIVLNVKEDYSRFRCDATSRELLLDFIFCGGAPQLRSLEFRRHEADWSLHTLKARPQVITTLRTLIMHDELSGFDATDTLGMRERFPNLKFLKFRECTALYRKKLLRYHPDLLITIEPL